MAQVRAALRLVAAAALVAVLCFPAEAARKRSRKPAARKPAASAAATARPDSALYDQARVYAAALKKSPSRQKNRANWEAAALRFRRVVDRYPKSALCDDALLNMGNLYREMGERFASARYRAEAVKSYRWIVSEYPASKLGDPALYAVYELSRDTSGAGKDKTSEAARAYLAAYPRGTHAADLREGMKKRAPEKVASLPAPPPPGTSEVFDLRQWGGDNSVRVVLDLDKTVELHHARGGDDANRLVVGLANARLHPNLADKVVHRDDGLLRGAQAGAAHRQRRGPGARLRRPAHLLGLLPAESAAARDRRAGTGTRCCERRSRACFVAAAERSTACSGACCCRSS